MSFVFYDPWTDLCRVESQLRNIHDQIHEPSPRTVLPVTKDVRKGSSSSSSACDEETAVCAPFRSAFCKEGMWWPAVDLKETKDGYELHAELPGVKKEDVCVELHGQGAGKRLVVSGKKVEESEKKEGDKWHRTERHFGQFERSFTVPVDTAPEDIKAKFGEDGVLVVTFPKPKPKVVEPVKIEVQ